MVSLHCPSSFTHFFFFQTMICLMLLLNLTYTKPSCHDEDRIALVQFNKTFLIAKSASDDPFAYPKVTHWIGDDCCLWNGVECDKDTGHVIGLDLSSSYLYGPTNSWSSLFQLVHLRRLNLADNDFNFSHIPYKVGHFSQLTLLNLSSSGFYGQVPSDIAQLSTLTTLDLGRNWLELKRSDFGLLFRNMTSLQKLVLKNVSISSNFPTTLANLTSLSYLDLTYCNLFGRIPASLFLRNLTKLSFLSLTGNQFSGPIPSSLTDMAELIYLDLGDNSFSGKLPFGMANLTQLKYLDLSQNNFTPGDLSWLGKQTKLAELYLQKVNLVGDIPSSLCKLTHLQFLVLSRNKLIGNLPYEISNLTELVVLDLGFNEMHGPIPKSISKLVNLKWLSLGPNPFIGTVKFEIFLSLRYLKFLQLSGGNLSLIIEIHNNATPLPKFNDLILPDCNLREFPYFLRYQDELESLSLAENKLQGHIPNWIGHLRTLLVLDLSNNILIGFEKSSVLSSLTSLKLLMLDGNKLQGPIPNLPTSILKFCADDNILTGHIPPSICNLTSLTELDLSYNNLSGSIPPCLGDLNDSLLSLSLTNNSFRGSIPVTLGNLTNLRLIDLSNNQLHGLLPRSLANCRRLQAIDLSENHISGRIPSWLGDLPKLEVLMLRSNNLFGEIRALETQSRFPKLRILDLSFNNFTGVLPNEFFLNLSGIKSINVDHLEYLVVDYTKYLNGSKIIIEVRAQITLANKGNQIQYEKIPNILAAIDLSSNRFHGKIPTSIASLKMLNVLNLSNNHLSGIIPPILCNLSRLESLDLSSNVLSGEIPGELSQLTFLGFFDVSYNQLVGPIPQGNQFNTFENSSYWGNVGLCGKPLSNTCDNPDASFPPPWNFEKGESSDSSMDWKIVVIGYGCGLVVGLLFGFWTTAVKYEWFVKTFRIRQGRPRRRRLPGRGARAA